MVREELVMELRAAVRKARESGASVRRDGIRFKTRRAVREVNIEVSPLPASEIHEQCFLILFEEAQRVSAPPSRPAAARAWQRSGIRQCFKLQNELARRREHVRRSYGNRNPPMRS